MSLPQKGCSACCLALRAFAMSWKTEDSKPKGEAVLDDKFAKKPNPYDPNLVQRGH